MCSLRPGDRQKPLVTAHQQDRNGCCIRLSSPRGPKGLLIGGLEEEEELSGEFGAIWGNQRGHGHCSE